MAFTSSLEVKDDAALITLTGELDAASANTFKDSVEQAATHQPKRLVLLMANLEYMASAGLRVLIFAKQKMGSDVDIYVVGAQEGVLETLSKTGFDRSVILADSY
ncbi:MAG: anti-sigma factor antagonist [Cyanobacteriota bacterium]|nr:anti-sigma factor antagonist [Cyanobacteriota bacterium]